MVVNNVVLSLGVKEVSAACVKEESTKNKCRITHFRATHWSVEMYYSYYALIGEWTALQFIIHHQKNFTDELRYQVTENGNSREGQQE